MRIGESVSDDTVGTFLNCDFVANSAEDGGAVKIGSSASVLFESTDFDANTASDDGGAVFSEQADLVTFSSSTFSNNTAQNDGGGI